MNYLKKLQRNSKALSPIFATLILIAIAVIAGIVVYMFTSGTIAGLTGSGATAQDKVAIQAVQVTPGAAGYFTVLAQSTGGNDVVLGTTALIKNAAGQVVDSAAATSGTILTTVTPITVTPSVDILAGSYTVTLISAGGNPINSPAFTVTAQVDGT